MSEAVFGPESSVVMSAGMYAVGTRSSPRKQDRVRQGLVSHRRELLVDYLGPDGHVADTCQNAREGEGSEREGGGDPGAQPQAPLLGRLGRLRGVRHKGRGL